MQNVLLVEDNTEAQIMVRSVLGAGQKIQVSVAPTAAEAFKLLEQNHYDLILLDIQLPDKDGFVVCLELQSNEKTRGIPIIFLTGNDSATDKVTAFSMGAEDYIVKPFNALELKARVESKLGKIRQKEEGEMILLKGHLSFNLALQKAIISENGTEKELNLTALEFRLLYHLARNEERILSREQLLSAVWGEHVGVVDRTVDTHVCSLRRKLGSYSHYIESVTGVGYRFTLTSHPKK